MRRRDFLGAMVAGVACRSSAAPLPRIAASTIQPHLEALSVFGRPVGGTFQSGASMIGSRIAAGKSSADELDRVSRGLTKREAIRRIGGDPTHLDAARIGEGAFDAYVELHIEQGGNLAREGVAIGVVDGIVSVD